MQTILTEMAPAPRGHYSQAVVHAGLVYVSGTLPIDPASGQPVTGEIEAQMECALQKRFSFPLNPVFSFCKTGFLSVLVRIITQKPGFEG